jgi:hypothetical protein
LFRGDGPRLGEADFNVVLGQSGPSLSGVFDTNQNAYIEIQVDTNSPITPRQQILTAPYAFNAAKLNGYGWDSVFSGGNPTSTLIDSRLSPNVALRKGGNAFTGNQTITSGDVGIGTTAPDARLDIAGDVHVGTTTNGGHIRFRRDDGRLSASIQSTANNMELSINSGGGGSQVKIQGDPKGGFVSLNPDGGNVGIGSQRPSYKLDVNGVINCGFMQVAAGTPEMRFISPGNQSFLLRAEGNGGNSKFSILEWAGNTPTYKLTVQWNGNVGIGTQNPAYTLDVNGTIRASNVNPSDKRWKKNVRPLEHALEKVGALRGVRFDWRAEDFPELNFESGGQIGFIAQDVEAVLPEAVSTDNQGYRSIGYNKIIPVLVEAMKEQQTQLQKKAAEIKDLQGRLERLERLLKTKMESEQ